MRTAEAGKLLLPVEATSLNPSQPVDSNVYDRLAIVASRNGGYTNPHEDGDPNIPILKESKAFPGAVAAHI